MSDDDGIKRSRRKVTLSGSVGIAQAQLLQETLAPLLTRKAKVSIDLGAVERIDTAILQLLLAFSREGQARGMPVDWTALNESSIDAARLVGLDDELCFGSTNP